MMSLFVLAQMLLAIDANLSSQPVQSLFFSNTLTPPTVSGSPQVFTSEAALASACKAYLQGFSGTGPGFVYYCNGGSGQDFILELTGTGDVLEYGLLVQGYRNIIIRGVTFALVCQTEAYLTSEGEGGDGGNGPGELDDNTYCRQPYGGIVMHVDPEASGSAWVEGVLVKLHSATGGHEGDMMIWRSPVSQPTQNQTQDMFVVNSHFQGGEGCTASSLHSDVFQNQGDPDSDPDVPRGIYFENVTARYGLEGITIHDHGSPGYQAQVWINDLNMDRVLTWDEGCGSAGPALSYNLDDDDGDNLLNYITLAGDFYFDDESDDPRFGYTGPVTPVFYGDGCTTECSEFPGATQGQPVSDYAPEENVGSTNYDSPFCQSGDLHSSCAASWE